MAARRLPARTEDVGKALRDVKDRWLDISRVTQTRPTGRRYNGKAQPRPQPPGAGKALRSRRRGGPCGVGCSACWAADAPAQWKYRQSPPPLSTFSRDSRPIGTSEST